MYVSANVRFLSLHSRMKLYKRHLRFGTEAVKRKNSTTVIFNFVTIAVTGYWGLPSLSITEIISYNILRYKLTRCQWY